MTRAFIYTTAAILAATAGAISFAQGEPAQDANTTGYMTTQISAVHRDAPLDIHIGYPTQQTDTSTTIAQNLLFDGFTAQQDASASAQGAPVIVFSHGSGGRAIQAGWLAAQLASQGMIVIAPDHHGTMTRDSDPFQTPMIWQRTRDMSAALDALDNGALAQFNADMSQVAAMGFSLGGGATLSLAGARLSKEDFISYCAEPSGTPDCDWMEAAGVDFTQIDQALYEADWRDPRINGVFAIDPALSRAMTSDSLASIDMAVMTLGLGDAQSVPMAVDAAHLTDQIAGADHAWVTQAAHFSFLPTCGIIGKLATATMGDDNICSDWGLRNRDDVHAEIAGHAAAFFANLFDGPS